MFAILNRLKPPPIWPLIILFAAILYFICCYELEKPYSLYACQQSSIDKCSDFFRNDLIRNTWRDFAVIGVPGLIAMFVGRKSIKFLCIWSACFAYWTYLVATGTGGVDGQNGCENCEVGSGLMLVFSVVAFICAMIVAFDRRMIRRSTESPGA